jgi:serine/threonine protein kinase
MGQLLGSGGFGSVYLATDERLHRPVAIKVCSTQRLPAHEAAEAARLFQSEALTLARLRHPGLTAIWDYFNHENEWYLVMEYVPGETLRSRLKRAAGPLPEAEALSYARQLCSVLSYLHRQHPPVVFRDLKPANIMVTPEGQLKLIDFGIARLFSPGKIADTAQFGTPGYAPPEQYGGQTEPRSDIYSMGVVLHQMLTGHNPMSSPFALPPVRTLNPAISERLEELVTRATAYDIDDRVPTADELCRELDAPVLRSAPAAQWTTAVPVRAPLPSAGSHQQRGGTTAMGTQQRSSATASRQAWTPAPRTLPSRPEPTGWGRSMMLVFWLVLLIGGLGLGGYLLKEQITSLSGGLSIVAPAPALADETMPMTVFSAAPDGSENLYAQYGSDDIRQLTQYPPTIKATQPAISPDGQRIAFTKQITHIDPQTQESSTQLQVWVMDADGGNAQQILPNYAHTRAPAWSPNGQELAVEASDAANAWTDYDIVIVNVSTGESRPLIASRYWEGGPTWSPDGSKIAYHARRPGVSCMQLYMLDAQGGVPQPEQLTDLSGQDCSAGSSGDYWADWSPDGKQLAFGRKLNGNQQIALLDLATRRVQTVDTGSLAAGYPRWSKDGQELLFEQGRDNDITLARLNLETGKIRAVPTKYRGSHLADWH